ncbi:kelch-like protein 7 [Gordionus sp. m RMFG-2023]|uniref:kelch-like protein 7 n=1 Tax=Gordionus sp. m RMFG-2023 TaxID=3053472 RepID=UPI0031FCA288
MYNISDEKWSLVCPLKTARLAIASCSHLGQIWAVGGFENVKIGSNAISTHLQSPIVAKVECYNPTTDLWNRKKDMRFSRCHASLVEAKGKMYVCGGATLFSHGQISPPTNVVDIKQNSNINSTKATIMSMPAIDVYLDDLDNWTYITGMKVPRHRAACINYENKIYIIGGVSSLSNAELKSVECFDLDKNKWLDGIEPLPQSSLGPTSCLIAKNFLHQL